MANKPQGKRHGGVQKQPDNRGRQKQGDQKSAAAVRNDDIATKATLDRLEKITGEVDEPALFEGELRREMDELDAETDEEVDALEMDLLQEDEMANPGDGSGRIVDDVSEEDLARFTEVGPDAPDRGAISVAPGRDDTSKTLRRHYLNTEIARADAVVEDNLDEPMDEIEVDREPDEGTGA